MLAYALCTASLFTVRISFRGANRGPVVAEAECISSARVTAYSGRVEREQDGMAAKSDTSRSVLKNR